MLAALGISSLLLGGYDSGAEFIDITRYAEVTPFTGAWLLLIVLTGICLPSQAMEFDLKSVAVLDLAHEDV